METTSERLKKALAIRDMKQKDVVEKTGIDRGALSSYISGKYKPKQTNLLLLSKALDVDITWLMGYDVPMEPDKEIKTAAQLANRIRKDSKGQKMLSDYYELSEENQDIIIDMIKALKAKKGED